MSDRVGLLVVNQRIQIPLAEFEYTFARSSGPGGQNVNKVNSKATLRWKIHESPSLPDDVRQRFLHRYGSRVTLDGELVMSSQAYRDQGRNIADCLEKLKELLTAVAVPPKKRRPTKPTFGSKQRRLEGKRVQSQKKNQRRGPQLGD